MKIISAPAGTGVYSGLYLIGNEQSLCKIPEILLNEESENQFVIGGVSVGCILEVVMNTLVLNSEDELENIINTAVNNIQEMTSIVCRKDLVSEEI